MNRARLVTYKQFRSEIQAYIEASRSQFAFKTVATKITSDPMEVASFGKGGKIGKTSKKDKKSKKRKGDGKRAKKECQHQNQNSNPSKDAVCWHFGKKGHLSTECWSNPNNQSRSRDTQNKTSKGKTKNVTDKGAGSLDQREQEPQPQPALASSPDLASIGTLVRSLHLDHESWLRWTFDTSAAISAFPLDARIGRESIANDCSYNTVSCELISDRGGPRVQRTILYGYGVTFQGRKADVLKTLISASKSSQ